MANPALSNTRSKADEQHEALVRGLSALDRHVAALDVDHQARCRRLERQVERLSRRLEWTGFALRVLVLVNLIWVIAT